MTPCVLWTGGRTGNGYGAVRRNGRQIGAHVAAAIDAGMRPAPGQCVCHMCDNPLCVNPEHLFLGTPAANRHDCALKRRTAAGERNGRAKLTAAKAEEIRRRLRAGETQRALAAVFGVSDTTIRLIGRGDLWQP
jgi:hypothetical protein